MDCYGVLKCFSTCDFLMPVLDFNVVYSFIQADNILLRSNKYVLVEYGFNYVENISAHLLTHNQ